MLLPPARMPFIMFEPMVVVETGPLGDSPLKKPFVSNHLLRGLSLKGGAPCHRSNQGDG